MNFAQVRSITSQTSTARKANRGGRCRQWLPFALLPLVFFLGAASTIDPILAIAAITISALVIIVAARFRPVYSAYPASVVRSDWIVVLLPTVVALRAFSTRATLVIVALLVAAAFVRKADLKFRIQAGPLVVLIAASAIVLSRPAYFSSLLTFFLIGTLVLRLVMTVDAQRIIVSLIDGCGLYLVANVLCHAAGLRSSASGDRIGGLVESTGFVRTIYPLTSSLNTPPAIAAIYIASVSFLILESGRIRRSLRLICLLAAIIVLFAAGARASVVIAAVLTVTVLCCPFITRWIAQGATLLVAFFAFILPNISTFIQFAIRPLVSLAPGRDIEGPSTISLNGRDYIWARSIDYWFDRVNDLPHMLLGFGANGHYRSGASLIYRDRFDSIIRNPDLASMHNSFLQQLFDGGILGWLLLIGATYWASARLAKRRRDWANVGIAAIVAMTALVLSGMTEISLAPGATHETFWLLVVLVGVACQARDSRADATRYTASEPSASMGGAGHPAIQQLPGDGEERKLLKF